MKAKVIYLQTGFWKQLKADTSIAGFQCLMNVYEAISEANLRTDIEDEVWDSDPFLMILWKKYLTSQADIELFDIITVGKPDENAEDLSAVYLTTEDSRKCEEIGFHYGVMAINNVDMPQKEHLFKGDGFLLKKNATHYEDRYVRYEKKIHYPCNSMILIDPYILTNMKNIDGNLSYLLDAMIPDKKLEIDFHLTIFSMLGKDNIDITNGEKYFREIENIMKAIRKGLNFKLSLFSIGKGEEFHRRMVITNNLFFSADDGFDVFKDDSRANKNATFNVVLPRLVGNSRQDMSNYLRWIKIAKERSKKQSDRQFWGTRENRLFDLV